MIKKLTTKIQQLNPQLPDDSKTFATSLVIEPDTEELKMQKGTIYAVLEVKTTHTVSIQNQTNTSTPAETHITIKMIRDVLANTYYQTNTISPIQSLEKAISAVKETLEKDPIYAQANSTEINILTCVLWGNVLYIVQYGNPKSFLIRNGEVRPIKTLTEGPYATASGVITDGDVVMACTNDFVEQYPPEKLLSTQFSNKELNQTQASILIKFILDTQFSKDEMIHFSTPAKQAKIPPQKVLAKLTNSAKRSLQPLINKLNKSKDYARTKATHKTTQVVHNRSVSEIQPKIKTKTPQQLMEIQTGIQKKPHIKIRKKPHFKISRNVSIGMLTLVLLLSLGITIRQKRINPLKQVQEPIELADQKQPAETVAGIETEKEIMPLIDDSAFYDLKAIDPTRDIQPTSIALVGNTIVVTTKGKGVLYISSIDTPKFTKINLNDPNKDFGIDTKVGEIKNLKAISSTEVIFNDRESVYVFDVNTNRITERYSARGMNIIDTYRNFVYNIENNTIVKYTKNPTQNTLAGKVWGTSQDFKDAKGMGISYSIYIITKEGNLVRYTAGEKDSLSAKQASITNVEGLENIAAREFADKLYIARKDSDGNYTILEIDKDGNIIQTYKPTQGTWNNVRGIDAYGNTLVILDNTRIYKINLK